MCIRDRLYGWSRGRCSWFLNDCRGRQRGGGGGFRTLIQTKARHESSSTSAGIILACVFVSSALFGVGRASRLGHSVFIPLYSTCNCTSLPPPDRWLAVSMIKYDASVLLLQRTEFSSGLVPLLSQGQIKTPKASTQYS